MPIFDEVATTATLAELSVPLRVVFAHLCATRFAPHDPLLDRLWRELGGALLSADELATALDQTALADDEDHEAAVLAYCVRTRATGAPADAARTARHAFLAAVNRDELVGQRELARQARDLAELASIVAPDPGLVLALMRLRSEDDRASPLRDPTVISALEYVRRDPKRFFSGDTPSAPGLVTWLTRDLLELGHGTCTLRHVGAWWIVGSDSDWLQHDRFSPVELFARAVTAPSRSDGDLRAEILVTAFARSVWITRDGDASRIVGDAPPPEVLQATADLHRAVLFAM